MNRSLISCLVAAVALVAAGAALGSRAAHPSIHVQPASVAPGGHVRVYGNAGSCSAGSQLMAISAAFPGHAFGVGELTGRVHANHTFSIRGHLRSGVKAGTYSVGARCGGGNLGVSALLHVG